MRVVSLLPAATEIVCAVGAGASLVGVSHECDYPPCVRSLPAVTRAKLDAQASSAAIDADVRRLVRDGISLYDLDLERLAALRPDVVVTQHQCDVCAVPYAAVAEAARSVLGSHVAIVSLAPWTLGEIFADVERVASALDRPAAGARVADALRSRLASLATRTHALARPTVACIEWLDPPMLAAHWTAEIVEAAGGAYPYARAGERSAIAAWHTVAASDPDVVVIVPCGFPIAQTRREIGRLLARHEWRALRAVATGRTWMVDGNAYFNRPGPRLVESAEILAALLHPTACGELMIADAAEAVAP